MSDRWRYACPECGSRQVRRCGGVQGDDRTEAWRCDRDTCFARFGQPLDLKAD